MDSYQAIYDAVSRKVAYCDTNQIMREALDFSVVRAHMDEAVNEQYRPSVLYRPKIMLDGNKWIALYGDNIQDGVCGCGDSPDEAMRAFDSAWYARVAA